MTSDLLRGGLADPAPVAYCRHVPICASCGSPCRPPLCLPCRRRLRPGGESTIGAVPVRFAFHHSGTARRLVHRVKYEGLTSAADVMAGAMAQLLDGTAQCIVPIPRAIVRRALYGVDPALELARRVARISGLPLATPLRAPLWWPRNAGRDVTTRRRPHFSVVEVPPGTVLVDDVVTSGATVLGALGATGTGPIASVVAATSPGMIAAAKAPIASGRLRVSTTAWQRTVESGPGTAVRKPLL